ncbi:MAG: hypothetical protein ACFFBD_07945, partial [Candidatus Hodarchaeota archaeon]
MVAVEALVFVGFTVWLKIQPTIIEHIKNKMIGQLYERTLDVLKSLTKKAQTLLGIDPLTRIFKSAEDIFPSELPKASLLKCLGETFNIIAKNPSLKLNKPTFIEVAQNVFDRLAESHQKGIPSGLAEHIYDHVSTRLVFHFIAVKSKKAEDFRAYMVADSLAKTEELQITQKNFRKTSGCQASVNTSTCCRHFS